MLLIIIVQPSVSCIKPIVIQHIFNVSAVVEVYTKIIIVETGYM